MKYDLFISKFIIKEIQNESHIMTLPTLKLLVLNVGHVNNRGNIIYIGIGKFVQTFPSPICMFCISVAEI